MIGEGKTRRKGVGKTGMVTHDSRPEVSFPVRMFNTIVLAINSAFSGCFSIADESAASASGRRPR